MFESPIPIPPRVIRGFECDGFTAGVAFAVSLTRFPQ
jgi:hypothetical protein